MTGPGGPDRFRSLRSWRDPSPKSHFAGTHRVMRPEQTLERVAPFLKELGITRVANVTGLDIVGLPVVQVCRPNSRSLAVSQGKGLTLAAAKASGIMESLELYHAEHIDLPLWRGSAEERAESGCIARVDDLPHTVSSRYSARLPLLWIGGTELVTDRPMLVPYEVVNLDTRPPDAEGSGCFAASSNGLASGNTMLEAISHGICEVVERDATTLWELLPEAAREQTRINLGTVDDQSCLDAITRCHEAGLRVVAWDLSQDIPLPSFRCMITELTDDPSRLIYASAGMGCHPCREIAFLRALTEAAQSRLTLIAGSREDITHRDFALDPTQIDQLRLLLAKTEAPGRRRFTDTPSTVAPSVADDVAWELECLTKNGFDQVVAVDLSKDRFGVPVARMVIPGLEALAKMPGYLPGRRARERLEGQP